MSPRCVTLTEEQIAVLKEYQDRIQDATLQINDLNTNILMWHNSYQRLIKKLANQKGWSIDRTALTYDGKYIVVTESWNGIVPNEDKLKEGEDNAEAISSTSTS